MGKLSLGDLERYEGEERLEKFKKKSKTGNKRREKTKHRNNIDFSQLNWENDEDYR